VIETSDINIQQPPPQNEMVFTAELIDAKTGEVVRCEIGRSAMLDLRKIRVKPVFCSCGWGVIMMGDVIREPDGSLIYCEPKTPRNCGACGKGIMVKEE